MNVQQPAFKSCDPRDYTKEPIYLDLSELYKRQLSIAAVKATSTIKWIGKKV